MEVARTRGELARLVAGRRPGQPGGSEGSGGSDGSGVALVPTMGALHDGHRSLVARAAAECDQVVVSIFVNPLQFGDAEDLRRYPRTLDADLATCEAVGATVVFVPSVEEMYPSWPDPPATTVRVGELGGRFEGASRPGHFDGVATVVTKLFAIAGPCRAYFGEKDFQQLAIVRQLARDLSFPVTVVGCPTVREPDGLALSSRNTRLGAAERQAAGVLWQALATGCRALDAGESSPRALAKLMGDVVAGEPLARLDYAAAVDADRLTEPSGIGPGDRVRLLVAAQVGAVRLIDNCDPRGAGAPCPDRGAGETGSTGHDGAAPTAPRGS
ncbi:MAG TPA: pantoate--beta-alanine ligase [Acidimicrobiales bacterium]